MRALRFLLAALPLFLPLALKADGPEIFWRETYHNFGAFNEDDGLARTAFRYVNTGDEPLVLLNVRTTCGCTVADWSRKPLAPGDSAEIIVDYDPAGRLGRFEKGVIVDTNTEPRRTRLTIKGVVVGGFASVRAQYPVQQGPLALRKGSALVGDVLKGKLKTMFVNAYNSSTDTIVPQIGPLPDWLHISLEPSRIPPGEQASFIVYFRSDRCPVWGISETVARISADSDLEPFDFPVVASVVEDFSSLSDKDLARAPVLVVEPERIIVPALSASASDPVRTSFRIINKGHTPLQIRRIWSPDPAIKVEMPKKTTLKPGKHVDVPCLITPEALQGDILNSRITLITNDPANSVSSVRVVGEILPR
ncbi:MAG: DUF1573 domain-containing protein [Muribaculaceae bacterium]|nr:DUF1573 domain-containing protein [Muribaculaceae bacterium]